MGDGILEECPGCGRKGIRHNAGGLCAGCASRKRRQDPESRERDRESSRKWKKKHPHRDSRPHSSKRDGPTGRDPANVHVHPDVTAFCASCGNQLLDPELLCGFCAIELPPYDKLRLMELLPGQDEQWHEYFSLLDHIELNEMIRQAHLERMRRNRAHLQRFVAPHMTDLYRRDGNGILKVDGPDHHRRCKVCKELVVNCKGHANDVAA